MLTTRRPRPPGENVLIASWAALAAHSPGASLVTTRRYVAAVFPAWAPLNNAILLDPPSTASASTAADELSEVYTRACVPTWALWIPDPAADLDASDEVNSVDCMTRDTTTLIMTLDLPARMRSHATVVSTTVEAANEAGDQPIPAATLPAPVDTSDVDGWVLVADDNAVAGAWTFRSGTEVGVYAVGTAPAWRRRGLARTLMWNVLANAYRAGARTASLQSTPMGEALYLSLGFRPVGRYDEWVPT